MSTPLVHVTGLPSGARARLCGQGATATGAVVNGPPTKPSLPWGTEGSRWPSASTCCAADRYRGTPYAGESPCLCRRHRGGEGSHRARGSPCRREAHAAETAGTATAAGGEGGVQPTPAGPTPTPGEEGVARRPHPAPPTESPLTASARARAGHRRGREGRVTPRGFGGALVCLQSRRETWGARRRIRPVTEV